MSGAIIEEERVSGVCCHNLHDLSFISMLGQYRRLLFSAYGPKGGLILISNAVGRDTVAASSSDITKQLAFRHPCVKYINALISAQNVSCGLGGLYTGILCVRLLEEALACEDSTPHRIITDVSEWIITQILTHMAEFPDQVVTDLDIGNMEQVTSYVKTILGSKCCLDFNKAEIDNLSLQIVKAFIKSIPKEGSSGSFGHVNISQEGAPGLDARVFDGLLYREPDFDSKLWRKMSMLPRVVNVLLFAVPLLPDEGTNESVHWRGSHTKEEVFVRKTVACLLSSLKERNVHLLVNQKSIHPVIKFEIEREGYIVLERLGTVATDALMKLSGCQAITNLCHLTKEMSLIGIGKLSSLENVSLKGKNYILLKQETSCISTLLLPAVNPSIEAALKESTESCLAALKMVVVDGKVVSGGGCLETWLATQVNHLVSVNIGHLISLTGVSSHHIIKVANAFIRVFMELAIRLGGGSSTTKLDWCVDSVYHHLWHSEPGIVSGKVSPRGSDRQKSREITHKCVCGLLTDDLIKHKYGGDWYQVDFQFNQDLSKPSPESKCFCETMTVDKTDREVNCHSSRGASESVSDSLDECVVVEEDVDSLEKTNDSVEEEGDSLEGRLESLEDDVDSLDDVLDIMVEPILSKFNHLKIDFDFQTQNVLYDSYLAKYNALRLAMEGFAQLFQIGQCVFDP